MRWWYLLRRAFFHEGEGLCSCSQRNQALKLYKFEGGNSRPNERDDVSMRYAFLKEGVVWGTR